MDDPIRTAPLLAAPRTPWFATAVAGYLLGMLLLGEFAWQHPALAILIWAALAPREGPRRFVRDWWPMVLFWLSYDGMRVFSENLFRRVAVEAPLRWEEMLFLSPSGIIWPFHFARWAQENASGLWAQGMGLYCNTIYLSHIFAVPVVLLILWLRGRRPLFRRLVWSLTVMHAGALAVYLAYPAAPPWWVYENGLVNPTAAHSMPMASAEGSVLSGLFQLNPNRFAAIPSLHAAYPVLLTLVLALHGVRGRWILLSAAYAASMWFACVYLNQHYIIDLLLGALLAAPALPVAARIRNG